MSNQEEDTVDDWESLENHPELDKKLQKMANDVEKELKKKEEEEEAKSKPTIMTLNCDASPFIPAPSIRILKRENNSTDSVTNAAQQKQASSSKSTKSLEEREAAYREARLRILGSAHDEYEDALIQEQG